MLLSRGPFHCGVEEGSGPERVISGVQNWTDPEARIYQNAARSRGYRVSSHAVFKTAIQMNEQRFEKFDLTKEGFDAYDVAVQPDPGSEISIDTLGGLSDSENELQAVLQARDALEKRLMLDPRQTALSAAADGPAGFGNIVGVGIGEKEAYGRPTGRVAVKVFVKDKLKDEDVASEARVPRSLGGVETDVEGTGEIRAQLYNRVYRPAPGGVSVSACGPGLTGTLGCLVSRGSELFILSNNHVIAGHNALPLNSTIAQPGGADFGVCPGHIIARLAQFVPITFSTNAFNMIDAAIARTSPELVDHRILRPGGRKPLEGDVVNPRLNMRVHKSGRTTEFTRGLIKAAKVTVDIDYGAFGLARFVNQFRVAGLSGSFSDKGDSGSVVQTSGDLHVGVDIPIGLLFAGNAATNTTFFNDMQTVVKTFQVSIVDF